MGKEAQQPRLFSADGPAAGNEEELSKTHRLVHTSRDTGDFGNQGDTGQCLDLYASAHEPCSRPVHANQVRDLILAPAHACQ
eukprot:315676-Pelagomonas_calceolata.AAC.1